ncbi:hypothetical protein OG413_39975 [Streptomyces sp. NBC_01433]|uniref:hypothetical protein n=1 Tax=Streptomyces sp. NBC_01433 TaxID=2903864 RepID=UPI0022579A53|nr:hypothetical protein [Streptomyces sp. NBC_01433]MCX4681377.1 hypothetical protein [Streptomyces sp. NBC_01433]
MPQSQTLPRPASIPAPAPLPLRTARDYTPFADRAERLRAQLADFWGKPVRGLPRAVDLMTSMYLTATGRDLIEDPHAIGLCFSMCDNFAAAYRTSDVWVAPHSMADRIARHPLVNQASVIVGSLEDAAPARDGLVYFPTPIQLGHLHPVHGLAWHMEGTGNDLAFTVETITATQLLPTRLPPMVAASTKLPLAPYCPNGVSTLVDGVLAGYGNPDTFGAPDPATALALVLAFWELRAPIARDDDGPCDPDTVEDTLTVFQHAGPGHGTKKSAHGRKGKRAKQSPRKRRIRIIREPAHVPATAPRPQPTDAASPDLAAEHIPEPNWRDDTLRWKVSKKYQNRCPNPHQHRAIIEAGGECKPVLVPVEAHVNGPKGRDVDPRRTVRIVPERP